MKKNLVIIVLLLLIGIVLLFPNNNIKSTKIEKNNYKNNESLAGRTKVYYQLDVDKRGVNNQFLSGVDFRINTYNNVISKKVNEDDDEELYYIYDFTESEGTNKGYNILSDTQKEVVSNIKNTDDLINLLSNKTISDIQLECSNSTIDDNNHSVAATDKNGKLIGLMFCKLSFPTIFYLEEASVPSGYIKDKVIIPGSISIYYSIDNSDLIDFNKISDNMPTYANGNNPEYITYLRENVFDNENYDIKINHIDLGNSPYLYIKYGDVDRNRLVGTNFEEAYNYWTQYGINNENCSDKDTLTSYFNNSDSDDSNQNLYSTCPIYLKNSKGTANIVVESKVNNLQSTIVKTGTKLSYRISVKNTGEVDSIDNTVTSKLPKGFKYVEGSASNNGVYSNGSVTWQVDRVKKDEKVDLTYEAIVPENASGIKSYVEEASVTSFTLQKTIEATPTKVSVQTINPQTSTQAMIIALIMSIIIGLSVYLGIYYKSQKN